MTAYNGNAIGSLGCHKTLDFSEDLRCGESMCIPETIMDADAGRHTRE